MKNEKQKIKNGTTPIIFGIFFLAAMILWSGTVAAVPPPGVGGTFLGDVVDPVGDAAVRNTVPVPLADPDTGRPNLLRSGVRMMTALIVVIGIMLLVAYGAKRFLSRKGALPGKEAMIRILATRYLGSKNSLSVVDVDGERFVIGLSPQGISFLTSLCNVEGEDGGRNSFGKVLRSHLDEG